MGRIIVMVCILTLCGVLSVVAVENKGAEQICVDGGSRGVVPFPHHRHQNALGECNICHDLFPQEQGSIARLKKEGILIKKQIMNKHCVKCHKTKKRAGEATGPTTCAKCHIKDKV